MKRIAAIAMFIFICNGAWARKVDGYKILYKRFHIALDISSPLAFSKAGGGVELRYRQISFTTFYTLYYGVYPGYQYGGIAKVFLFSRKYSETFLYGKILSGRTAYDPTKITFLTNSKQIDYPFKDGISGLEYKGAGVGIGRRFSTKHFFAEVNAGLKYCQITYADDADRKDKQPYFTLFNTLGPGAIPDLNFHFGIQF